MFKIDLEVMVIMFIISSDTRNFILKKRFVVLYVCVGVERKSIPHEVQEPGWLIYKV